VAESSSVQPMGMVTRCVSMCLRRERVAKVEDSFEGREDITFDCHNM